MATASSNDCVDLDSSKEYRRGVLGKLARDRKRTSTGKKMFHRKNWQKRFFVLRANKLDYYVSRAKFIKRGHRSGGFDLQPGDVAISMEDTKGGRYNFELRRGEATLLSMYAEDAVDRNLWVAAIMEAIAEI